MIELTKVNKERLISELKSAYELLGENYTQLFEFKYASSIEFKCYIDDCIKTQESGLENSISGENFESFQTTFCNRTSFLTVIKLLLARVCEAANNYKPYSNAKEVLNTSLQDIIDKLSKKYEAGEADINRISSYHRKGYELMNPYEIASVEILEGEEKPWAHMHAVEKSIEIIENIEKLLHSHRLSYDVTNEGILLGEAYEGLVNGGVRKSLGQFYTPDYIIKVILDTTLDKVDILENPFVKVLDPACGSGYFLLAAYDLLKQKFSCNLKSLQERYAEETYEIAIRKRIKLIKGREYWQRENLHYHILTHCIYGADIDEFAVQLTSASLLLKNSNGFTGDLNIVQCDSLITWERNESREEQVTFLTDKKLESDQNYYVHNSKMQLFWESKYDIIIGNPPYIGHKQLPMQYKRCIEEKYKEVFKDKSDLSYCFFQRALSILKPGGRVGFITSRYFMESPTGRSLRQYLKENSTIEFIIDFCGADIFKGVGIASAIFILSKVEIKSNFIKVSKLKGDSFDFGNVENLKKLTRAANKPKNNAEVHEDSKLESQWKSNQESKPKEAEIESFLVSQELLEHERWILVPEWKKNIYKRIQESCSFKLGDIVTSFQGVITGCDKAFIVNEDQIEVACLERELLKPWIKNSNVNRYVSDSPSLKIIYSDSIDSEEDYPCSIQYIKRYMGKLLDRRECKKGLRKWYELQWGRNLELFLKDKVIYPYKSKNNRFAVDRSGYLCSADVYSFCVREQYNSYSPEYLCGVLNSKIYEFYFQLFAKKLGGGMYDYYPNSVLCLCIPDVERCGEIESLSRKIISLLGCCTNISEEARLETLKKVGQCEAEINSILAQYFNLTQEELRLICS